MQAPAMEEGKNRLVVRDVTVARSADPNASTCHGTSTENIRHKWISEIQQRVRLRRNNHTATKSSNTTNTYAPVCADSSQSTSPQQRNIFKEIVDDFSPRGDQKILRAIGRTAAVNAAVLATAATGGSAGAVGFLTGGAITAKRLGDGVVNEDEKEVAKSLAVYSCATGASVAGQAIAGALVLGLTGASLPLAGAIAFGAGCCSGITAGAVSEWTVDSVLDNKSKKSGDAAGESDDEDNNQNHEVELVEGVKHTVEDNIDDICHSDDEDSFSFEEEICDGKACW